MHHWKQAVGLHDSASAASSSVCCKRDVVLDVPIPASSSEAALKTAQLAHVAAAQEAFPRLVASPTGPGSLSSADSWRCVP